MKQFFGFTDHCTFCLCEVLTRCHRYGGFVLIVKSNIVTLSGGINILPDTAAEGEVRVGGGNGGGGVLYHTPWVCDGMYKL